LRDNFTVFATTPCRGLSVSRLGLITLMKYRILSVVVCMTVCARLASADPTTQRIRKLAQESNAALAGGDYSRVVELTYPKVVEMIGGREKMIETLRRGTEGMKAQGSAILGAEATEPKDVVASGDKQFAIVSMTVRVRVPDGVLRSKGFLIAISADHGATWTFLDGAGLTKETLPQVLPDFPSQLSLPAPEPPELERK
jgi:hypothetical protein